MLLFLVIKYFIALIAVILLSIAETNAQWDLNIFSYNNWAGAQSLNNNPAPNAPPPPPPAAQAAPAPAQTTSNPFGALPSVLLLTLLASRLTGRGSPYPQYPYYSGYGGYYPYTPYYYSYYGRYPYYYYYYG
ncbi:unnamed protein product [Cercopithifilaria johnstoni]|uniref:Uncharacterized protein n=1 Tax=Cercopithifilaria johnstoni TaxID=2874296 RepID=A0A8J2Q841_9BILA|nr:unnamed protein product [Cercopithifilaria johnstoni]